MDTPFAYLFQYYPHGSDAISETGKRLCYGLKGWKTPAVRSFLDHIELNAPEFLGAYLAEDCLLIPAPRSSMYDPKNLWPANELCLKLQEINNFPGVRNILVREKSIPKSSFQEPQDRPTLRTHYNTISAKTEILPEGIQNLIIVDDVITRGNTSAACAMRLRESYPDHKIMVLAAVSTQRNPIQRIYNPTEGVLRINRESFTVQRL